MEGAARGGGREVMRREVTTDEDGEVIVIYHDLSHLACQKPETCQDCCIPGMKVLVWHKGLACAKSVA